MAIKPKKTDQDAAFKELLAKNSAQRSATTKPNPKVIRKPSTKPATANKKKTGRPTLYSLELATVICERLSKGESLTKLAKDNMMPDAATIYRWLNDNISFCEMYARAKDESADFMVDEMLEIADTKAFDRETAAAAKVQIDTRKWIASKLKPQKYGDKQQIEISGELKIRQLGDDELDTRLLSILNRLTGKAAGDDDSAS